MLMTLLIADKTNIETLNLECNKTIFVKGNLQVIIQKR